MPLDAHPDRVLDDGRLERSFRLPLRAECGVYRFEDPGVVPDSGSQQKQVVVSIGRDLPRLVGDGSLFALGSGSALELVLARQRLGLAVDRGTRNRLAYQSERD